MATVTGLTAARMQEIIDATIVDADIIGGHLILTKDDGSTYDAGAVGPAGKGTAFPAGATDGDLFVRTDQVGDPLYKYTDGAWTPLAGGLIKATSFPAGPSDGDTIVRTDLNGSPIFAYSTENGWEQQPRMGAVTVPHVNVQKNAAQSVPDRTQTTVSWPIEVSDTNNMHDTVTNNSRITINTPGVYQIHAQIELFQQCSRGVYIVRNGTEMLAISERSDGISGDNAYIETDVTVLCAAGDYLEVQVWHALGGPNNIQGVARSNRFSATWLGGAGQTVDERGVPACRLFHSASVSIPLAGIETLLPWDSEVYDTDSMHDTATNNTRIYIKTPGLYRVSCQVAWPNNTSGYRELGFRRNGVAVAWSDMSPVGPSQYQQGFAIIMCAAGDYLEVGAIQGAGSLSLTSGQPYTWFAAEMIGSGKTVTPFARAYRDTSQSIASNTVTAISFNQERADNDSIHDTVTNATRFTCRTAGVYQIGACIGWSPYTPIVGASKRQIFIKKNGTIDLGAVEAHPNDNSFCPMNISATAELAVGDYVEILVNSTEATTVGNSTSTQQYSADAWMTKIGAPIAGQTGIEVVESWHIVGAAGEPAFQNGWQSVDTVKFKRDRGVTYVRGAAGVTGVSGTVFTLPAGYRPLSGTVRTFQRQNTGGTVEVDVNSDGTIVSPVGKSPGWIGLDLIFRND